MTEEARLVTGVDSEHSRQDSRQESTEDSSQDSSQEPSPESSSAKVLSFPGEAPSKQSQQPATPPPATVSDQGQASAPRAADEAAAINRAEQAYNQARGPDSTRLPEASFLSLVNMLGVEAAMHLGLIQTPGEEPLPVDTEAARHLIDMLGVLQTKTRGNLTPEEDHLFENMLADLRMQFVAVSRRR